MPKKSGNQNKNNVPTSDTFLVHISILNNGNTKVPSFHNVSGSKPQSRQTK